MCLIVVGWQIDPTYPLIVAANRDEFHARPTAPLGHWPGEPGIIGGRDLSAGGTWLGLGTSGRFAAVTNVREPGMAPGMRSRGQLTAEFLRSTCPAIDFAEAIAGGDYAGFNLLLGDGETLVYFSNRDGQPRRLPPGIHGLSNHRLDTPWPKLLHAREHFASAIGQLPDDNALFATLADRHIVSDERLPDTGVSLERERMLSAVFVRSADYGTRASTVLWRQAGGRFRIREKSFDARGEVCADTCIDGG